MGNGEFNAGGNPAMDIQGGVEISSVSSCNRNQDTCQGVKLTFFTGSHLAPKYFKLVANSKKLVVKIHTSY